MKNINLRNFGFILLGLIVVTQFESANANTKLSKNHYAFVKIQNEITTRFLNTHSQCVNISSKLVCTHVLNTNRPDIQSGTNVIWQLLHTNPNKPNDDTFWIKNVKLGMYLTSNSSRIARLATFNGTDKFQVWRVVKGENKIYRISNNVTGFFLHSDFYGNVFTNSSSLSSSVVGDDLVEIPKWYMEFVFLSNLEDMMFETKGIYERIGPITLTILGVNLAADYNNTISLGFITSNTFQKWTIHPTNETGVFVIKNLDTKLNLAWPNSARLSSGDSIDLFSVRTTIPNPSDPTQRWMISSNRKSCLISAFVNGVAKSLRLSLSPNSTSQLYKLIYALSNNSASCDPDTLGKILYF